MNFDKLYESVVSGTLVQEKKGRIKLPKEQSRKVEEIVFSWNKNEADGVPEDYRDLTDWDTYQEVIAIRDVEFTKDNNKNVAIFSVFAPERTPIERVEKAIKSFMEKFPKVKDFKLEITGE
jgi:hypothetical protein